MVETLGWIPRNPSAATAVISCKRRLVVIRRERGEKIGIGPKEMETGRTRDKEQGGRERIQLLTPVLWCPLFFTSFRNIHAHRNKRWT